jgi:hypothetical protein
MRASVVSTIENTQTGKGDRTNASLYSFVPDTEFEYVNENVVIDNKSYHIFKENSRQYTKSILFA